MDENREYKDRPSHSGRRPSWPGVVMLGIVTAGVLGSVIFSFTEGDVIGVPSVKELLEGTESIKEAGTKGTSGEQQGLLLGATDQTQSASGARPKGPLDVSDVVEATMPSIVAITSETVQVVESYFYGTVEIPEESSGSGIIIGKNDQEFLIATNYHVVEDADTMTVCFSVEEDYAEDAIVTAKIKGRDTARDLAVVAVEEKDVPRRIRNMIQVAVLGDSDELQVGQQAIAIGNALGYGQSVTAGIVSAVDRQMEVEGEQQNFLQTDAAINFGNSGGALLNSAGQVIGINSAKITGQGAEGMGYAIPINEAKPILEELSDQTAREKVEASKRGSLGAELRSVSQEARQLYDIPAGVLIYQVYEDSAAARAGLHQGDIITALDGNRVSSPEALEGLLAYYEAGETVELVYETGIGGVYESKQVSVVLQENTASSYAESYSQEELGPISPYDFFREDPWLGNWW